MSSEDMSLVPTRRLDGALSAAQLFFDDNGNNAHSLRFSFSPAGGNLPQRHVVGDVKTRELSGFVEDKVFSSEDRDRYFSPAGAPDLAGELRPSIYGGGDTAERRGTLDIRDRKRGGAGWVEDENQDDEDDDEDEDEDANEEDSDEEGDIERMELVRSCILSGGDKTAGSDNDNIRNGHSRDIIPFGVPGNDANKAGTSKNSQQRGLANFQSMVTLADPDGDMYLPQFWHTSEGTSQGQKDAAGGDSGCGFSGRKDNSASINLGDTLRAIFSDPIKRVLMDDAMILPCGHSFGSGGMEHVIRMKSCYTCSQPVTEESVLPNLSLRAAVRAFRCEEEQICRASKRRRERVDQDKNNYPDLGHLDPHRGRGVQFPFAVADRVIIKGNKRTPQRFVGRKAVVTTQCLNGWYVVKTLDNAECVKLQYRSLAKVPDNSSSKMMLDKTTPHWL